MSFKLVFLASNSDFLFFIVGHSNAQQLLDDFNRTNSNTVGNSWVESETSSSTINITSNQVVLGTSGEEDREYLYRDCATLYNTTLSGNAYVMTWMANIRQSRTDPSGFDDGNYGVAFVLGATSNNFTNGNGYAVLYGQSGTTDPLRLVRFTGGVDQNSNLTNIISGTGTDFGSEYLTVKVTYTPSTNSWSLFYASSSSAFISPLTATYTQIGSATVNNTYTSSNLRYVGCIYNHNDGSSENAFFDNVYVPSEIVISSNPVSQSVCTGANLTFAASATGTPLVTVKWQKLNGTTWTDISGATSANYTIVSAISANAGQYRALFTNSFGSVPTTPATLVLNSASVGGNVSSGSTYCGGANGGTLTLSGYTGNILQWESSIDGGNSWTTISNTTASLSYNNLAATTQYRVLVQSASCPSAYSGISTISILPAPSVFNVTGGGTYCSADQGSVIGLSNSEIGVNYQLRNGASNVGASIAGNGSPLSFGLQSAPGTYSVIATHAVSLCTKSMTGSTTVSMLSSPSVTASASSNNLCIGNSTNLFSNGASNSYSVPQTFSTTVNSSIPNNSATGISSTIVVSGAPVSMTQVTNLSVTINISHNDDDEIEAYLIRPGGTISNTSNGNFMNTIAAGQSICLVADRGGNSNNFTNTVFSDVAANPISAGSAPFSGTYKPENAFSTLTGNPNGAWTLKVVDDFNATNPGNSFISWSITVSTDDGISYSWSSNPSGFTSLVQNPVNITPAVSSEYIVTVTNLLNGCTASGTTNVSFSPYPAVYANCLTQNDGICAGSNTGSINVSASSGTPPYSGTGLFDGLLAGTYTYVVTDDNGCSATCSSTIVNGIPTVITTQPVSGSTICEGSNKSFSVGANGYAVTYQWQDNSSGSFADMPGETSGTLNLTAVPYTFNGRQYRCIVTGTCGEVISNPVSLSIIAPSFGGTISSPATVCPGNNSGTLILSGNTGTILNWESSTDNGNNWTFISNATTSLNYLNLSVNTLYRAVVRNGSGCNTSASIPVQIDIDPLSPSLFAITGGDTYCSNTTGATLGLNGSETGVSYQLKKSGLNFGSPMTGTGSAISFGDFTAGNYSIVATNLTSNCSRSLGAITLTMLDAPSVTASSSTAAFCEGGTTSLSSLAVSATGNTPVTFSATVNGTIPNNSATGISSGILVSGVPTSMSQVTGISVTINATHYNDADVEAYLIRPGGTISTASNGGYFNTITPGESICLVADRGGSNNNFTGTVFSDAAANPISSGAAPFSGTFRPEVAFSSLTGNPNGTWILKILDDSNGSSSTGTLQSWSITMNLANGLSYTWTSTPSGFSSPDQNPGIVSPNTSAIYSVMVTDQVNNCTATSSVPVTVYPGINLTCTLVSNGCNGSNNGVIDVVASGGTIPYTGDGLKAGLTPGPHTFTVTDSRGCFSSCSSVISEPVSLSSSASVVSAIICNGLSDGKAFVSASGGTPPYSGTGLKTGLVPGNNSFIVTDANGCTSVASVSIYEPQVLIATVAVNSPVSCIGSSDGSFLVGASGGTPPYSGTGTMSGYAAGSFTFTVTDNNGCSAASGSTISVVDNQPPVISCPSDISVNTDAGDCGALVNFTVTASDNCSATVVSVPPSGTFFPVGTTSVVSSATDPSGNTTTCSFNISVTDNELPVIHCPANMNVNSDAGFCGAVVNFSVTTSDNCSASVVSLPTSGSFFPVGTTTVQSIATDVHGNTSNCSFAITVTDNELPIITCPSNINVSTDAGSCGAVVSYDVTTTDNCSASVVSVPASGSVFPVGTTTVTSTSTDVHGNSSQCSFTVTVTDTELPVVTCPANINVNTDAGSCGAVVNFNVTTTDNCSASVVSVPASGSAFPVGTTIVNSTATDIHGNSSQCSFTVTVTDTELPVITCPPNINVNTDAGSCGAVVNFIVTTTDNCSASVVSVPASGSVFPVGTTTVTSTSTDVHGNSSQCSFTVTVTDTESPVINCPANITVNNDGGSCGAIVNFAVTATDNCSATVTTVPSSGSLFPFGTTLVYSTATDPSGNSSDCSFTVTVSDSEAPVLNCPSNITVNTDPGVCGANVSFTETGSDNCSFTVASVPASGSFFTVGTTTVNTTATDAQGNSSVCSFTVTVVDNELPVVFCPANIVVDNDSGLCGAKVLFTVSATDNCSASVVSIPPSGSTFPVGVTTVHSIATDIHGNSSACSFTVTVVDNELPVIFCPANISVNTNAASCGANVNFNVTTTDNCSATVVSTPASGTLFPTGITTVQSTATDVHGNISICSFTVTVTDNEAPVINCPSNINVYNDPGSCGAIVNFSVTATDNCSATVVSIPPSGTLFPIGLTTVQSTATDRQGNMSHCSFTVRVTDNTSPLIICPADRTVNTDPGICGARVTFSLSATDNCNAAIQANPPSGSVFPRGDNTVSITATDPSGNISVCSFHINVVDREAPVVYNCPTDIIRYVNQSCDTTINWVLPDVSDNCSASLSANHNPGDVFAPGTTVVTYTATDPSGNLSMCSFNVIVIDTMKPVITDCTSNIVIPQSSQLNGAIVNWEEPVASDNCGISTTSNFSPGDTFPVGVTTVTYTFRDGSNNVSSCTFTVTVTSTTGIQEIGSNTIRVFPNPFTDDFIIRMSGGFKEEKSYRIYSTSGMEVAIGSFYKNEYKITTRDFAAGVYILEIIYNDGERVYKPIVKN